MGKPNILIVEDNPISRKILKLSLESENYTVVEAFDGASALEKAKKQKFDLIIQDIILPDMDGFSLNKELKKIPEYEETPIFALSGFLNELDTPSKHPDFTTFLLKPIQPSHLLDVVNAHFPISRPSNVSTGNGKYILIADDNPIQLKLFAMQLRNAGFEVATAVDGAIALQEIKKRRPDAVISDILMPNMDGFSLSLEIKRDPTLASIPIILLTSHYLEDDDLALAKKVGASRYLTRTPDVENLISELLKILNTETLVPQDAPFELTEDIKEKHTIRSIRQLEQQVLDNTKLAQRCSLLMSQLSLIDGIANALTTSSQDINESLKEILYFCLDATGISKGALYIKKFDTIVLSQQVGYPEDQKEKVESFFGASVLISKIIEKDKPFSIPSVYLDGKEAQLFLENAKVKSAFIIPLFSGSEHLGILFLGSDFINFASESIKELIRTLGRQFSQSIALATAFDKLSSSENRYRQLVEISPEAIYILQEEKFIYANNAAVKLLNANSAEDLLKHSFYDFFLPDYQKVIKQYVLESEKQISTSLSEVKIKNLAGDVLDVEIVVSPFLYQEKKALYMIMKDITERKRSALHLEIQYAIAWILAESETLSVATTKILEIICERLQWDCGTIWAVNKEEDVLRCTKVWQSSNIKNHAFEAESQNLNCIPGAELPGQVWKERHAIWRTDIISDKTFMRKKSIVEIGLNTAVVFPIFYENKVLGVIEFFSKKIIPRNSDLLLWFESIGNQLGVFLTRKHLEKQMLYMAEHDVLTGLSNRNLLEQYLNTALMNAKINNQQLAVLFLDLDHFKFINDSMGHEIGDLLLKEVSDRLRQCLRPQDTISRLGGDEFVIIIPNFYEKEEIITIINRLKHDISRQITINKREFFIAVSIGISLYPIDGDTVQTLIKSADIAMYAAKEKGRNNFQFCTQEMTEKAENLGILQTNLHQALVNNEFILYYQPKIDVATQKISGMEALIRWQRPEGILLPGSFIPAAERSDIIISIGEWVIKAACLQNKAWQAAELPITLSINISVRNLNKQLLKVMERALLETNIKPDSIEIELTESALMINIENNIQILRELKNMGLRISVDDFGTGYSSLSYLKRFPIDTLKVDQSFVRNIARDPDDAAIVTAIIAMAHSLGFKVIAEGVETEEQLRFLCQHGCDEIQGYYFSRPLPEKEATHFMQTAKIAWNFK